MSDITAVISGSFRKHLRQMIAIRGILRQNHINVLSPVGDFAINPNHEFVVLDTDLVKDHQLLQDSVFAKIRCASMLVVANIDGYIGIAAALEIGYAIANGVQIYSVEPLRDPNIAPYCRDLAAVIKSQELSYA
jgi:hypothetical protein